MSCLAHLMPPAAGLGRRQRSRPDCHTGRKRPLDRRADACGTRAVAGPPRFRRDL